MFQYKEIIYKNKHFKLKLLILMVLYIVILNIIFFTELNQNNYLNLLYLPVVLSTLFFNVIGGILGSISSGIILSLIPMSSCYYYNNNFEFCFSEFFFLIIFSLFLGYIFSIMKKQYEDLEKITQYDLITSLPNRSILSLELNRLKSEKKSFSLVAVYIDNIREIFNIIGPSKGDIILKSISYYFESLKQNPNISIYNSYSLKFEFLLVAYDSDEVELWLKKFEEDIHNIPINIDGHNIYLEAFLGAACSEESINSDTIIKQAYEAIDYAYKTHRDHYVYNKKLEGSLATTYLVSQIERAVNHNEFYIEYQPKLNIIKNKIDGVEALIRWKHPKLGIIPPAEFIPKLEKTDTIKKLTNWVLNKVVKDIKDWDLKGINLNVAVNICPRDLRCNNFDLNLFKLLKANNLPPNRIALEITETDLITEKDKVVDTLAILRLKGIRISIDDFGTGYSSLSYLSSLPIDHIKIDRSFINNLSKDKRKQELLKNTIHMAHSLGKIVVAEGVEDKPTFDLLAKLKCEQLQGYYIAKPMSKKSLENYLYNLKDEPFYYKIL